MENNLLKNFHEQIKKQVIKDLNKMRKIEGIKVNKIYNFYYVRKGTKQIQFQFDYKNAKNGGVSFEGKIVIVEENNNTVNVLNSYKFTDYNQLIEGVNELIKTL